MRQGTFFFIILVTLDKMKNVAYSYNTNNIIQCIILQKIQV